MDPPRPTRVQPCPVDAAWLGSATVDPGGAFAVATLGTRTVEHTVGRYGLDDGGQVMLCIPTADDACEPQFDDASGLGYVTVAAQRPSGEPADARLQARYQRDFWVRPWDRAIVVKVRDGSLAEGDRLRIVLGDTSGGSPGWRLQSFPQREHLLPVLVDPFGTKEFHWLPAEPMIEIVPGPPARADVVLPTRAAAGEPVRGHVRFCDACWNPVRTAAGRARLTCGRPVDGLPLEVDCADGITAFGPLTFPEPGVYRIEVAGAALRGVSNPVDVRPADEPERRVLWADMHGQTRETVGTGTVAEYFSYARDRALIDVCAWQGNDFQVTDALWREVQAETRRFHQPGRFVTFLGYEWSGLTPAGGDHNILYLRDDQPIHRSSHWQVHDGSDTSSDRYPIGELWRQFAGRDDVLAVGHVGGRYCNLALAEGGFPQLVEIHSHHGTFEWMAGEAIRRGLTVGFVAQSDDHTGRPGLSAPLHPVSRGFVTFDTFGGYTGIWADALTREAVWQALRARHCYATTGRRTLVELNAAGAMMGDVLRWSRSKPLPFRARVVADGAPLLDLELRRDLDVACRQRWPDDEAAPWIRVEWSGVRVRSRTKNADWDGRIRADGGRILEFRPYAFDQPGQGITRAGPAELAVISSTSGDVDGVMLRLDSPDARVTFESASATVSFRAEEITPEPRVFPAGGVNRQVRVSRTAPQVRAHEALLRWAEQSPAAGRHAYWLRAVQADGHMAWSSPLYVEFTDG
jgi:hypothetical protein